MQMIRNKKAQEAATLTWIIATLTIFLIMFIYVLIVGIWAAQQTLTLSQPKITQEKIQAKADLTLTKNLISFLNMRIENGERMRELILKSSKDDALRKEIFEKEAEKFLYENFEIGGFYDLSRDRFWIRIYDYNEEIKQMGYNWIYSIHKGYITNGYCDPYMEDAYLMSVFLKPDKKIAICANVENENK